MAIRHLGLLAGLLLASALLAFSLLSSVAAQETPAEGQETPTAEPTPGPDVTTVVRIEVDQAEAPIPKGEEFEARVVVEDVEHLAAFSFAISYDPKRVQPVVEKRSQAETPAGTPIEGQGEDVVRTRDVGQFFADSERSDVFCGDPVVEKSTVSLACVTRAAPLCLGGPPGASGSGLLGGVFFKSKGGGTTTLTLVNTGLALDDFADCGAQVVGAAEGLPDGCLVFRDAPSVSAQELSCEEDGTLASIVEGPVEVEGQTWVRLEGLGWAPTEFLQAEGQVPLIPHRREDATIELASGGGLSWAVIAPIIAVVAIVVVGAGAGYLWYRRRATGTAA